MYRIDMKDLARAMIAGRAHRWHAHARYPAHPRPNIASQATPLARQATWAFFTAPSRANACRDLSKLPAARLKAGVGPFIKTYA